MIKFVSFILCILCVSFVAVFAVAKSVSAGMGQVGNYVVTSREVVISNYIDHFLLLGPQQKKSKDLESWKLTLGSEEFQKKLSQIMIELLVKMEAESFSVAQASSDELKQEASLVKEGLKDWKAWIELEVSDAEIDQIVLRRKTARNFLKFKTESSGVVISDEEAKSYYDKNRIKFGTVPFAQFKNSIKDMLSQQQMEEKLKDWFELLKRKHRVKFLRNEVEVK